MYVDDWQADNTICMHLWKYCVDSHWVGSRRSGAAAEQVNSGLLERNEAKKRGPEVFFPGLTKPNGLTGHNRDLALELLFAFCPRLTPTMVLKS